VVLAVTGAQDPPTGQPVQLVVKQALPVLRVEDYWPAPQHRVLAEAAALQWTHTHTPHWSPAVVDVDADEMVLIMAAAPSSWRDWKAELLTGRADSGVARRLGAWLAQWHSASLDLDSLPTRLREDREILEVLRLQPYHETVAQRRPDVSAAILALTERIRTTHRCLVHGDFSPKNVLLGPTTRPDRACWVIDFEVAHVGDPVFDLAFAVSHLILKATYRPERAADYDTAVAALVAGYHDQVDPTLVGHCEDGYLSAQVGALLLARVYGKSPVEYLTGHGKEKVTALGTRLLLDPVPDAAHIIAQRRAHSA
jgi:Ser/Thr protein kinase RdoA (MazF antagonist)